MMMNNNCEIAQDMLKNSMDKNTFTDCAKCQPVPSGRFTDRLTFDSAQKTAVSVRDGVQEYLGSELGIDPADRVFSVYRSPATIANAANLMSGLTLTDDHIAITDSPADPKDSIGAVTQSTMIDMIDSELKSTVGVQNVIDVSQQVLSLLKSGKRELSLGYTADLVEHEQYDFEQRNIMPHHLAVVDRGRCGDKCSFNDTTGGQKMPKFTDAEGKPNLEEIVEMIGALPEAMKKLDAEQMAKVLPMITEILSIARADDKSAETTEEVAADAEKVEDMSAEKVEDGVTEETKDTEKTYSDKAFSDAIQDALKRHTEVVEKALGFVDSGYVMAGKSTAQIMRDAIKTEHGSEQFSDAELPVAFRLLRSSKHDLKTFGDTQSELQKLKNKEL